MKPVSVIYLMLMSVSAWAQTYPVKGQYPATAYPVCGADLIQQGSAPEGSTASSPIDACGDRFTDQNPFYYTFVVYSAGTLGFVITPNDPTDNYDWMLYDITGHIPADIYNISSMNITGNRSVTRGRTGTRINEQPNTECVSAPSDKISAFAPMPALIKGHQYLLLVTHASTPQSGYSLAFTGGSAVINDPALPRLLSVVVSCDNKTLTVGITKFVRCISLAADGSDFVIPTSPFPIVSAVGLNCSPQFDFNYLELNLSSPLPPGNYSLVVQTGTDNNTIIEDCRMEMPVGDKIDFTVPGTQPALDSLTPPACSPNTLQLVFSSPIQCSSIAADGSDFMISGTSPATVVKAEGFCSANSTNTILLTLDSPINMDGNYQVSVVTGTDGNTLTNLCNYSVPVGSSLPFTVKGAVSAAFDYTIGYGCKQDTINLIYLPANGVYSWLWNIDSTLTDNSLNPGIIETVFGWKNVQHIVSNGLCSDTVSEKINLDNGLAAAFESPKEVCPKNTIPFTNISTGNIVSYYWDFGDGTNSILQNPPDHLYPDTWAGKTYAVRLIAQNNMGCLDTAIAQIIKMQSCVIAVPSAFTPNGDGKNDFLYPLNAFTVTDLEFQVFNRLGQLVFETRDGSKKWDGTINGHLQDTGSYIWILQYTDGSGKKFSLKGSSVLIR